MSDWSNVEKLAISGQKIMAIKELRSLTGVGLKEAKDAVEHFEAHRQWPAQYDRQTDPNLRPAQAVVQAANSRRAEVEQQVARHEKIGAIKLVREITSFGLREAKDAVDHFEAHGVWQPGVLAAFGEPPGQPASVVPAQAQPAPPRAASNTSRDPQLASVLQALASTLGYAPEVRLAVRARRAPHDGQLVMLGDRACFVREERGQWVVDPMITYGMVTRVEAQSGSLRTVLYVSAAYLHERFELDGPDADAALALFRVFAP